MFYVGTLHLINDIVTKNTVQRKMNETEEQIVSKYVLFTSLWCRDYIVEMVSQALAVGER